MADPTALEVSAGVELLLQANQERRQARYLTALDLYLESIKLLGDNARILAAIASCYYAMCFSQSGDQGACLSAVQWTERAIALEPDNALLYADLGEYCELATLDYEKAAWAFRRAIELEPCRVRPYLGASSLYGVPEGVVSLQEAICWLERVVELLPNDPVWHILLAERYAEAGRVSDATSEATVALVCQQPLAEGDVERVRRVLAE